MTLARALSAYANLQFLLCLGFGCGLALTAVLKLCRHELSAREELRMNYLLLAMALICALFQPLLPPNQIFQPVAKIWSAPSVKNFAGSLPSLDQSGYLSLRSQTPQWPGHSLSLFWLAGMLAVFALGGGILLRDLRRLWKLRQNSFRLRKIGRCVLWLNDGIAVPFSYALGREAHVVIPTRLLMQTRDFKIAVTHELQHHRQGDTRWVYVLWFLSLACVLNPFLYLWRRSVLEIQEFACDEALVDQRKTNSQDYACCLLQVAETAARSANSPVCATGLSFLTGRQLLKRRIEKMFTQKNRSWGGVLRIPFGLAVLSLMTATAFASKNFVQDRRVTMAQAQAMAQKAQANSGFPIVINDLVLKQLNRYVGTPEGREFMQNALQRMQLYRPMLESKTDQYHTPSELLAIPIIESGYQNLAQDPNHKSWGAGLWMFIEPTARHWGLNVNSSTDERLNPELLTDAALRYLQSNHLMFSDWLLAILAYNVGENEVRNALLKTGMTDAWSLLRAGYENDRDYLPRVMAAILILKNPEILN